MVKKIAACLVVIIMLATLQACTGRDRTISISLDRTYGLTAGNNVIFDGNQAGMVKGVTYTKQGNYLAELLIRPEFKNAATVDSLFYVDYDPVNAGAMCVLIEQAKPGGRLLRDGAIVSAAKRPTAPDKLLEEFRQKAGEVTSEMKKQLEEFGESLSRRSKQMDDNLQTSADQLIERLRIFEGEIRRLPEREEVRELGRAFEELAGDLARAGETARQHFREELVPEIHRELEALRQRLEKSGRQEEVAPLEQQLEEMRAI